MMNNNEKMEQERRKLHQLIESEASKEEIQTQSEVLDKLIAAYYSAQNRLIRANSC